MTQMTGSLETLSLDLAKKICSYEGTEKAAWHMTQMNDSCRSLDKELDWSCDGIKKTARDQDTSFYSLEEQFHNLSTSSELTGPLTSTRRCDSDDSTMNKSDIWDMTWSDSHETLNLGFDWSYDATEETTMKEVNDITNDEELLIISLTP